MDTEPKCSCTYVWKMTGGSRREVRQLNPRCEVHGHLRPSYLKLVR